VTGWQWRRDRRWIWLGAATLALAGLAVGLLIALRPHPGAPRRAPFDQAVIRLAAAPAVHYRMALGGGSLTSDLRVATQGEALGTISLAGQHFETMTIGGKTYAKAPDGLLPGLSGGSGTGAADALKNRWVTGGALASDLLAPSLPPASSPSPSAPGSSTSTDQGSQAKTPLALAQRVLTALNDGSTVLPGASAARQSIDGVSALKATTPIGEVYVAADPPYRLLRIAPLTGASASVSGLPSLPAIPSIPSLPSGSGIPSFPSLPAAPSLPDLPSGLPSGLLGLPDPGGPANPGVRDAVFEAPAAPAASATLDFPTVTQDDIDAFFRQIENDTKQLTTAVNSDVQFHLDGAADMRCSSGGCLVTAHVTSDVLSTDPQAKATGGKVSATLTASVAIEGEPAGDCTSTALLPLTGTSDIKCEDAQAGAVFTEVDAMKKEEARAQSEEEGGEPVPYTVSSTGQAAVEAVAQVDVQVLLDQLHLDALPAQGPEATGTPVPDSQPSAAPSTDASARPSPSASPSPTRIEPSPDYLQNPKDCLQPVPTGAYASGKGWILNSSRRGGRTGTGTACLTAPVTGRTRPSGNPVGWADAVARAASLGLSNNDLARCHTIAARLGGANGAGSGNLSPCWQIPTNNSGDGMSGFEARIASAINGNPGWVCRYTVTPLYKSYEETSTIPSSYDMFVTCADPSGTLTYINGKSVPNAKLVKGRLENLGN
jgi:hypothetical protein